MRGGFPYLPRKAGEILAARTLDLRGRVNTRIATRRAAKNRR